MTAGELRSRSRALAASIGLQISSHLPALDCDVEPRPTEEAVGRLLAMSGPILMMYGMDGTRVQQWLWSERLIEHLTPSERHFVQGQGPRRVEFIYQGEGMWALAWALGLVVAMEHRSKCADTFAEMFPDLRTGESSAAFRSKARMRQTQELLQELDLLYCLHWAVREAERRKEGLPGGVVPFRIVERRRALEWLMSGEEWDDVSMDT